MASSNEEFTTNEEDQRNAAALQERLHDNAGRPTAAGDAFCTRLPSVEIAEGRHKYVLIKAHLNGEQQYVVTSKKFAAYHMNAAEPMVAKLEEAGYTDIDVVGGGRIILDSDNKKCEIFGFSYGFGKADHAKSRSVVLQDPRYRDFEVTISDEGY